VIFKNAVRIVTISLLSVYVDDRFLYGRLHRYGGLPFSIVGLALLAPMLLILMRTERRTRLKSSDSGMSCWFREENADAFWLVTSHETGTSNAERP
jgi:hypothetical protein